MGCILICLTDGAQSSIDIIADTLITTAISSVFGTVGDLACFFYELFDGAISANSASSQINGFEATMYTRTVHQFVYLMNSYGEPVYYGSANCVYYSFPEIAIIQNTSVQPAHCFVQKVQYKIDNESALVIYPVCYSYPIQAAD